MILKLLRLWFVFHSAYLDALRYTLFDDLQISELEMKCLIAPTKEERKLIRLDMLLKEPDEGEQDD